MLQTVRQFITEDGLLDPSTRDRHLAWCTARARALVGSLQGDTGLISARSLAAELPDQLSALTHANDPAEAARLLVLLQGSPALKGLPDLHLERIDAVLAATLPRPERDALLRQRAELLIRRRRFAEARQALAETDPSDPKGLLTRGHLLEGERKLPAALEAYQEAATRFRDQGDRAAHAQALSELARARFDPEDIGSTEPLCLEALDLARTLGDLGLEGRLLGYLGVIAKGRSRFHEAERYFRRSLERARALGDPAATVVQTIHAAGLLTYLDPDIETLNAYETELREALDIAGQLGALHLQCAATTVLLEFLIDADRAEDGAPLIDRLPSDWIETPALVRASCWTNIGAVRQLRGESTLADRAFAQATQAFDQSGHRSYIWRTQTFHALFLAEIGRWDEAEGLFQAAMAGASPPEAAAWIADARAAAQHLYEMGRHPDPQSMIGEADAHIERVELAPALKGIHAPIRSSREWVVKSLKRVLYQLSTNAP